MLHIFYLFIVLYFKNTYFILKTLSMLEFTSKPKTPPIIQIIHPIMN
ncbi:hypothetical protein MNB_SUP05-SYMBIONT-5-545 [hydrothermal vent metagenome]|uniref:Uncharacterized protein n=1 Tax=hydrothermal vent metagenome TaxID=652676 RepID=A0A1W1E1P0_9ZZZZ